MTETPGDQPTPAPDAVTPPAPAEPELTAPIAPVSGAPVDEPGYWEEHAAEQSSAPPENPWGPPPTPPVSASVEPVPPAPPLDNPYAAQPAPAANPYAVQPGTGANPYAPGANPYQLVPDHPSATTAMVLGLIGLVLGCMCGLGFIASPFAWVIGARVVREVDASQGRLGGRGNGMAGMIMGIIGTALLVLGLLAMIAFFVFAANDPSFGSGY